MTARERRLLKRVQNAVRLQTAAHLLADYALRERVDHERRVDEAHQPPEVRHVRHPQAVWGGGVEVALNYVLRPLQALVGHGREHLLLESWQQRTGRHRAHHERPALWRPPRGCMKTDDERRKEAFGWFLERCPWLHEESEVPLELARGVVRASAVWFQKAGEVAVPGQAEHVTWGLYGWRIYYSNSFEISLFVKAAARIIRSAYEDAIDGKPPKPAGLVRPIAYRAHECVSDYKDDLYDDYHHGRFVLAFGSQGILALEAAKFLIEKSDYSKALKWRPRARQPVQAPQPKRRSRMPVAHPDPQVQAAQQARKQAKRERELQQWVQQGMGRLRPGLGGFDGNLEAELHELLTRLAPLEVYGATTPEKAQERDRLWEQVLKRTKHDA